MKKIIIAVGVALSLLIGPASASTFEDIRDATVKLYEGDKYNCSAQVVRSDEEGTLILTAHHCVDPKSEVFNIRIETFNDEGKPVGIQTHYADILRLKKAVDTATLVLRDKDIRLPVVDVATEKEVEDQLRLGDEVLTAGFPGSNYDITFTLTDGRYSGKVNSLVPKLDYPFYKTSSTVAPGSSGGGLYAEIINWDDRDLGDSAPIQWKLVGVTSQADPGLPGITNIYAPIQAVHAVIPTAISRVVDDEKTPDRVIEKYINEKI